MYRIDSSPFAAIVNQPGAAMHRRTGPSARARGDLS
jgi:hypothetical protein